MQVADFYRTTLSALEIDPAAHWPAFETAYGGRAYHNLDHLTEMLQHLERHRAATTDPIPRDPALFGLALLYHDFVYRAHRSDNEARSADAAVALLGPTATPDRHRRCRRLIMATQEHFPDGTDNGDAALLIDLDLAVLARPAADYDRYVRAVRQEFRLYPDFLYRPGRKRALQSFLGREHIYHTAFGRAEYEAAARKNLTREIARITAG